MVEDVLNVWHDFDMDKLHFFKKFVRIFAMLSWMNAFNEFFMCTIVHAHQNHDYHFELRDNLWDMLCISHLHNQFVHLKFVMLKWLLNVSKHASETFVQQYMVHNVNMTDEVLASFWVAKAGWYLLCEWLLKLLTHANHRMK